MPDGLSPPAALLADGVYFNLPLDAYLADPAIGGSGLKKLMANPPDWWWERPENPLWTERPSEGRALGSVIHTLVLEGPDAYARRYVVAPDRADFPGAIATTEDAKEWLRSRDLKLTGAKSDLLDRIRDADATAPIWDDILAGVVQGRELIDPDADRYARLVAQFVRCDPDFAKLLSNGLAEVTIVWTDDNGVRCKARIDWWGPDGITELKKFGVPPRRGQDLMRHVLTLATNYGYDLQAVHEWTACAVAASRLASGTKRSRFVDSFGLFGRLTADESAIFAATLRAWAANRKPPFHWLFVQSPGALTGIAPRFRAGSDQWVAAIDMRNFALRQFQTFRERCGSEMWIRSEGVVDIDDTDWPAWASGN